MAGLKTERVTVDDVTYELTQLGAREGRRVLARLARLAGPVLGELGAIPSLTAGMKPDQIASKAISDDVLGKVLQKLAEAIDPDTLDYVCDEMAKASAVVVSQSQVVMLTNVVQYDVCFAGNHLRELKWLWACLNFQFADFLGVMVRTAPQAAAANPSA